MDLLLKEKYKCLPRPHLRMEIRFSGIKMRFKRNECALVFQALDALKKALRQEPLDAAVRAELHFSMGNQLREMNDLDQAFQVNLPLVIRILHVLVYNTYCIAYKIKSAVKSQEVSSVSSHLHTAPLWCPDTVTDTSVISFHLPSRLHFIPEETFHCLTPYSQHPLKGHFRRFSG